MIKNEVPTRKKSELLPDFSCFIDEIDKNGIDEQLLYKIIRRHKDNAKFNKKLYDRYMATSDGLPIFDRKPRYEEDNPINNKINNDFFGEIVDFKVGYFAGVPVDYNYSNTEEAEETTGGTDAVDKATKAVTDFVTRNNMFGVDMETTKNASIYGYSGRLFYIDTDGNERVMPVHGFETIVLSKTDISEPQYSIRYYETTDIDDVKSWIVEFYDNATYKTYKGMLSQLEFVEEKEHGFDYCPLQGITNNKECIGDAEKVLALIDAYDKGLSDNLNEMEAFAHAYLIFEGLRIDNNTIKEGQKTGSFVFPASGTQQGKAYYLTKNINDAFTEHNLERVEDNIYRFSRTPNLKDATFGTASGVSLKFKLHGLETKCGQFQAQVMNALQYMWKLLASVWAKKGINIDPLQCTANFNRNFPLDSLTNAQTAQALIGAGLPKREAWSIAIPEIDDIDYVMELLEEERENVEELYPQTKEPKSQDRLYKYQINLLEDYGEKIKNGDIKENEAIRLLKASISLPESEIRNLLGLDGEELEEELQESLEEKQKPVKA